MVQPAWLRDMNDRCAEGIPPDATYPLYKLQKLDIFRRIPRGLRKWTWNKERLLANLQHPDGPYLMLGTVMRQHGTYETLGTAECAQYTKEQISLMDPQYTFSNQHRAKFTRAQMCQVLDNVKALRRDNLVVHQNVVQQLEEALQVERERTIDTERIVEDQRHRFEQEQQQQSEENTARLHVERDRIRGLLEEQERRFQVQRKQQVDEYATKLQEERDRQEERLVKLQRQSTHSKEQVEQLEVEHAATVAQLEQLRRDNVALTELRETEAEQLEQLIREKEHLAAVQQTEAERRRLQLRLEYVGYKNSAQYIRARANKLEGFLRPPNDSRPIYRNIVRPPDQFPVGMNRIGGGTFGSVYHVTRGEQQAAIAKVLRPDSSRPRNQSEQAIVERELLISTQLRESVLFGLHAPGYALSLTELFTFPEQKFIIPNKDILDALQEACGRLNVTKKVDGKKRVLHYEVYVHDDQTARVINNMRTRAYRGHFRESTRSHSSMILMEPWDKTVIDYIDTHWENENLQTNLVHIVFDVLWSVYAAQIYVDGFRHNDLKANNIMVRSSNSTNLFQTSRVQDGGHQQFFIDRTVSTGIIDLGLSHTNLSSKFSRTKALPGTGIHYELDYAADPIFFLCDLQLSIQTIASKRKQVPSAHVMDCVNFIDSILHGFRLAGGRQDRFDFNAKKRSRSNPLPSALIDWYRVQRKNPVMIPQHILSHTYFNGIRDHRNLTPSTRVWTV